MTSLRFSRSLFCGALLLLAELTLQAEVRLPKVWSDHAVMQRDRPIHVWGWADPGERVTAALHAEKRGAVESASAATDADGHWSLYFLPRASGGSYTLEVKSSNTLTISDLVVGDVWLASGQSNMEMPLQGFPDSPPMKNGPEEIRAANRTEIRLLHEAKRTSLYPLRDQEASWQLSTPETAATFSAAAYFFAHEIQRDQRVPIGVIEADWGGTPAEAWTSLDTLGSDASLAPVFAERAADMDKQANADEAAERYAREDAAAKTAGRTPEKHPWRPQVDSWGAAELYNGMIAPFTPLAIRGVIWYQGESNSGLMRAPLYHSLFAAMITDWRQHFAQGDFPFLYVQISSYRSTPKEDWGTLRDAQRRTLSLVNTGMAVTLDVGLVDNVHPTDKQTVGHRLALAARAISYGEDVHHTGPLFRQATTDGVGMRVWFTGAEGKLVARGAALEGFELAGADHRFQPATAKIAGDGDSVEVQSPQVATPLYVRYAWPNAPQANLADSAGLPAPTFTSEPAPTPPAP